MNPHQQGGEPGRQRSPLTFQALSPTPRNQQAPAVTSSGNVLGYGSDYEYQNQPPRQGPPQPTMYAQLEGQWELSPHLFTAPYGQGLDQTLLTGPMTSPPMNNPFNPNFDHQEWIDNPYHQNWGGDSFSTNISQGFPPGDPSLSAFPIDMQRNNPGRVFSAPIPIVFTPGTPPGLEGYDSGDESGANLPGNFDLGTPVYEPQYQDVPGSVYSDVDEAMAQVGCPYPPEFMPPAEVPSHAYTQSPQFPTAQVQQTEAQETPRKRARKCTGQGYLHSNSSQPMGLQLPVPLSDNQVDSTSAAPQLQIQPLFNLPRTPAGSKYQVCKPAPLHQAYTSETVDPESVIKPVLTMTQSQEQQLESAAEKSVPAPSLPCRRWRMGLTRAQSSEGTASANIVNSDSDMDNFAEDPTCIVVRTSDEASLSESESDSDLSELSLLPDLSDGVASADSKLECELSDEDQSSDGHPDIKTSSDEELSVTDTEQEPASETTTSETGGMGTGPRGVKRCADEMVSGKQMLTRTAHSY